MIVFALVACTPDELAVALDASDVALLEEGAAAEIAERAAPLRHGEGRLSEWGPPLRDLEPEDADRFWLVEDELPIVDPSDRLRTVVDVNGVRLLVWLDREDFQPRVYEGAWAVPRPETATEAGVWLPAGWSVDEPSLGWARAVVQDPIVEAEVYVPSLAVDEVHLPPPSSPVRWGPDVPPVIDVYLRGTEVRDAPDGVVFATIDSPDMIWLGAELLDEGDDWLEVQFRAEDGVVVRGFVDRADADDHPTGGRGWSRCGGFRMGGGVRLGFGAPDLPEGTWLHDGPNGPIVGVTTRDLWVPLDVGEGWASFAWPTPYGEADLWVSL